MEHIKVPDNKEDGRSCPNKLVMRSFHEESTETEIALTYDKNLSEESTSLVEIVQRHAETVTKLEISSYESVSVPKNFKLTGIKCPNLKDLKLVFHEEVKTFVTEPIANGKLENLRLIFPYVCLAELPPQESLRSVPSLQFVILAFEKAYPFSKFAQLPLPNLKQLQLICVHDADTEHALQILSQWSETLEEFHLIVGDIPLQLLVAFRKLSIMAINGDYPDGFDEEGFPLLEELHFVSPRQLIEKMVPNLGVTKLGFCPDVDCMDLGRDRLEKESIQKWFLGMVTKFGKLFPNVEYFSCDITSLTKFGLDNDFSTTAIEAIRECFTVLKSLILSGHGLPVQIKVDPLTKTWNFICYEGMFLDDPFFQSFISRRYNACMMLLI